MNVMYLGTHVHCLVELKSGDRITIMQPNTMNDLPDRDTPIYVYWAFDDCLAIPI